MYEFDIDEKINQIKKEDEIIRKGYEVEHKQFWENFDKSFNDLDKNIDKSFNNGMKYFDNIDKSIDKNE